VSQHGDQERRRGAGGHRRRRPRGERGRAGERGADEEERRRRLDDRCDPRDQSGREGVSAERGRVTMSCEEGAKE
jgi:hypothetical protein